MDKDIEAQRKAAISNARAVLRRALELDDLAKDFAADTEIPPDVQRWVSAGRTILAMVVVESEAGNFSGAATALSAGERQMALVRRQLLLPAAIRGQPMIDGPKKDRRDGLARLIDEALATLPPRAIAKDVLAKCVAIDGGKIIQEVDPDDATISWRWRRKERTTTFKRFQNRLSDRRQKNLKPAKKT